MDNSNRPFLKNRAMSELSPLAQPSSSTDMHRNQSYGSIISYVGILRNSLMKSSSSTQALNRCDSMGSLSHRTLLQYLDSDDLVGLKSFLGTRQLQVDDRDENGTTVLMIASGRGASSFVKELIARGADVHAQDLDNWSALQFAAKSGHADIVEILLDNGAEIEHRDMGGWTALMWGSYKGHADVVSLLLQRGADVQAHGNYHLNPLLWASGRGHTEIVKLLVNTGGAKTNVGDKYGTTISV